ncbi:MAG TPA: holo-ACP synthase [Dehalococcoidia bacterium]|nr:holo-ACP synthase [Dehalococcoidia bacterium]
MTTLAVGVDLVEIGRVHRLLQRHRDRFRSRVFTPTELRLCRDRPHLLAVRFAAKEATMKALGTGIRGVAWREIEVLPNRRGKPLLFLYGRARERARKLGLTALDVSLTHSREYAMATVVGLQEEPPEDQEAERRWLLERLQPETQEGSSP